MKMALMLLILLTGMKGLANAGSSGFVDAPQGCYVKKSYPCQLRVTGGFLSIEAPALKLQLADQGALMFVSANEIQLLGGAFWVRQAKDLKVKLSSLLGLRISGEFFFQRQSDATTLIRNLAGEIEFQSSRVFPSEALPVGFQNWYGLLDTSGQVSRGMIRPIEMKGFLKDWLPVSGFSMAEAKGRLQFYHEAWAESLDLSVDLYSQVVARRIASVEEKERKRQERLDSQKREQIKLRNMFRERNGLGPIERP